MDDLSLSSELRRKYPQIIWVSGKRHKLPRQSGRVVVKLKFDVADGALYAKVYPGLYKATQWLRMSVLESEIEWALRNCLGEVVKLRSQSPRLVMTNKILKLVEDSGGRFSRVNSRFHRIEWEPEPVAWIRCATTTLSRVKKWPQEDLEKLFSAGVYAWVVQAWEEREVVRLKYAFTTFATEWVPETPKAFKNLVKSACDYAHSRKWRDHELRSNGY